MPKVDKPYTRAAFTRRHFKCIRFLWWSFISWRCGIYIPIHIHQNGTCYFWLFNSILWLSRGLCSWMVKIGRCLPSQLPRTAGGRKNPKNLSRTSCTCYTLGSIFKACMITWVWYAMRIVFAPVCIFAVYTSVFHRLHFQSLQLGLRIQKSSFHLWIFIVLV